jgi:hypothetical protein
VKWTQAKCYWNVHVLLDVLAWLRFDGNYEILAFVYHQVIWLVTAIAVLLMDVDLGLYVGVGFALLTIVFRAQRYVQNNVITQYWYSKRLSFLIFPSLVTNFSFLVFTHLSRNSFVRGRRISCSGRVPWLFLAWAWLLPEIVLIKQLIGRCSRYF